MKVIKIYSCHDKDKNVETQIKEALLKFIFPGGHAEKNRKSSYQSHNTSPDVENPPYKNPSI